MKILYKKILKLFLVPLLIVSTFGNDIKKDTEEAIKNIFSDDISIEMEVFNIPSQLKLKVEKEVKQRFFEDKLYIWKITKDSKVLGFAILDNVYGKSMPITFLVIFDNNLNIMNSSIIKYREPYGGAVKNEEWNSQFKGKNAESGFDVGDEINGISGATISVNSVSKGIRKLALLLPEIKDKLK